MDWSALLAKLPDAIPALVGALVGGSLAVAAGVAAQWLTHYFTRRRDAEKLQREKAEEFLQALFAHADWVDATLESLMRPVSYPASSPLDRIRALQLLYFPELEKPIMGISKALAPWLDLLHTQRQAQSKDYQAWLMAYDSAAFGPLHEAYMLAWVIAVDAIVAVAQSHPPRVRVVPNPPIDSKTVSRS